MMIQTETQVHTEHRHIQRATHRLTHTGTHMYSQTQRHLHTHPQWQRAPHTGNGSDIQPGCRCRGRAGDKEALSLARLPQSPDSLALQSPQEPSETPAEIPGILAKFQTQTSPSPSPDALLMKTVQAPPAPLPALGMCLSAQEK